MKIVVFGAGAIGSLIGALLSKNNDVILIGRPAHVHAIQKNGLKIQGKTRLSRQIPAAVSPEEITFSPDLLLLTVKSYDTEEAMKHIQPFISDKLIVCSFQNGLDNIEKIEKIVNRKQIIAGITTHGAQFITPGVIRHTGLGRTILGELDGEITPRIQRIAAVFTKAGIPTAVSKDIVTDLWKKAIVNSSINPLTAIFTCKNGYLLQNPILTGIMEQICVESTHIAKTHGIPVHSDEMLAITKEVVTNTAHNYSSMLQSIEKGKKTEIDSINGKIVETGSQHNCETFLNQIVMFLIKTLAPQ